MKNVLGLLVAAVLVFFSFSYGLRDLGPVLGAVQGGGVPGVFQVESKSRNTKSGDCGWKGTFTAEGGEVRRGVSYSGDTHCGSVEGEKFQARDTGARHMVFGGEKTGLGALIGVLVLSLPALLALLFLVLLVLGGALRVFARLRGVRGRSIRGLREGPRLSAAQRDMLRPRPRVAEPPPGWTPAPPRKPFQDGPDH